MSTDEQIEMAQAARAIHPEPMDWDTIIESGVKQYGMMMRFGEKFYTFDFESIYARYAEAVGVMPGSLSGHEKRQALVNAILEQA